MARSFALSTSQAVGTITAVDSGDWTFAVWLKPTSGNLNGIFVIGGGVQEMFFRPSATTIELRQTFGGTVPRTITSTSVPTGSWSVVFGTFNSSDNKCRIYLGSESSTPTEASYAQQPVGTGLRSTGGTALILGHNTASLGLNTFVGSMARATFLNRLLTTAEMEMFRLGWVPVKESASRGFWPLDSPTAAQCEDYLGLADLTSTDLTVSEDPRIPSVQPASL